MEPIPLLLLLVGGAVAGFIDSIAGGAALVTIPILSIVVGAGVQAIAASKVVGVAAALMALIVFYFHGHLDWSRGFAFGLWVGIGALFGSSLAPYLSVVYFKWMLILLCPLLLAVVWEKDRWAKVSERAHLPALPASKVILDPRCIAVGLACGLYDGFFGPAGGTFYFLALVFVVRMQILPAMAVAKLVNVISGLTALGNYASKGLVRWEEGFIMSAGVLLGAFIGARCATKGAAKVVRPVLACVVALLLCHLLLSN